MDGKYDSALLGILQNEGKVAPFLDAILGFLYRRTDFFRLMKTDTDKLGFPPGVAKKLLINIFSKYESQAQKDADRFEEMKKKNETNYEKEREATSTNTSQPDITAKNTSSETMNTVEEDCPTAASLTEPEDERGEEEKANSKDVMPTKMDTEESQQVKDEIAEGNSKEEQPKCDDDEDKEDPEQALQRRLLQANPLTYNGAERDNYLWSQIISEVDLRVKVPPHIKKGKQVQMTMKKNHIKVCYQQVDGSWNTVVDEALAWEINTEESMWTLSPGEFVHLNLEKKEERWWECVFVNEPKINTRKIDCSRPMADLDDEAQAKIEEMMYNQRQKQLGLPQSHEQKTHDMLRKAWDAEGSPFKGQPFDPSRFNTDANGVISMNQ